MLWDHRQLKREIAARAALLAAEQQNFTAQNDQFRTALRNKVTSPRTLGITFVVGLVYGLMGDRHWIPEGLRFMFWRGSMSLLFSLLAKPLSAAAKAATAPEV